MNRRKLIASLGIGASTALAGCMSSTDSDQDEENTSERPTAYQDLPRDEQEELLDEQLEEVYEERVEDGSLIKGHNIAIEGIEETTDDYVELFTTFSLNPVEDYTIKIHYNPVTTNQHGDWVFKNSTDPTFAPTATYDENNEEWIPTDIEQSKTLRYELNNSQLGNQVGSLTIPSEAYWERNVNVGRPNLRGGFYRDDIGDKGACHIVKFDIDTPPKMYETFVYTLTWEDKNNNSSRGGEMIANSPPILRVSDDRFVYPRTHQGRGRGIIHPNWGTKQNYQPDDRGYTMDNVYRTDIDGSGAESVKANITRLSTYGRLSSRVRNEFVNYSSVKTHGTHGPAYLDVHPQFPWSISYEISRSTIRQARQTADKHKSGKGEIGRVKALLDAPEVMNHSVVRDVASQLGDVCDMMNIESSIGQIRVVADFVQYFSHVDEDSPFGHPTNLAPGTAHPVITLVRGLGDCKDYTVLGNAILQQRPFNLNPSAIILPNIFDYVDQDTGDERSAGHISTTVPLNGLGINEQVLDDSTPPVYGEVGLPRINGVNHLYIEMSGPFEVGYVSADWLRATDFTTMDNYVS